MDKSQRRTLSESLINGHQFGGLISGDIDYKKKRKNYMFIMY